LSFRHNAARLEGERGRAERGAMPRPESFGVEAMFGRGNDTVPVNGDFRVRLADTARASSAQL
jgi:hypothetical protein